jgi:hypothetical protein
MERPKNSRKPDQKNFVPNPKGDQQVCRDCGSAAVVRRVFRQVRIPGMGGLCGTGEVKLEYSDPYCPECDIVPSSDGAPIEDR